MRRFILCLLIMLLAGCGTTASPTPEPTEPAAALTESVNEPLRFYVFALGDTPIPDGSVVIVLDQITLIPTSVPVARGQDTARNIQTALEAMRADPNNLWTSSDFTITEVTFNEGLATVRLTGTISGAGGAVLSAASTQILLTVFADEAVESAVITLNDETIRNLGISNSAEAQPADTIYTRADIARIIEGG